MTHVLEKYLPSLWEPFKIQCFLSVSCKGARDQETHEKFLSNRPNSIGNESVSQTS